MAASTSADTGGRPSRREEILVAAAQVIAERGFKEATVRDIGDAAGILSGSLYYHFDSKEQIVLDLLLPSVEASFAKGTELCEQAANATEALSALIRSSVHTTAQHPHKTVILHTSGRTFAEFKLLAPISKLRRDTLALWTGVITDGIASGEFRGDVETAFVVHAMLDGVLGVSRWFMEPPLGDAESITESLIRLYVSGLKPS